MLGPSRNRRSGHWSSSSLKSRPFTWRLSVISAVVLVPSILGIVTLIVTVLSFARIFQDHLISERDLSLEYQIALNASLNTVPCCDAADWSPNKAEKLAEKIPRIIHQTYKVAEIPEGDWATAHGLCLNLHRTENGWEHMFWTDESARNFLEENYSDFLETYDGYPYAIQRVDAMRYFILYHYGGIYIDLDIGCARVMDSLLKFPAFFPITAPLGISNDLIGSRKGHPLMRHLGRSLQAQGPSKRYLTKYITVFFTTGPMFVNGILTRYWSQGQHSPQDEVMILPINFYSETLTSYFMHFPGSSWHGNDAASFMVVVHYGWVFVIACVLLYVALFRCKIRKIMHATWCRSLRLHKDNPGRSRGARHGTDPAYRLASLKQFTHDDGSV